MIKRTVYIVCILEILLSDVHVLGLPMHHKESKRSAIQLFVSHSKLNWQPISFRADTMIEPLGYCMYRFTHSRFCYSLKLHPCRAIYMNTIKPDIFQNGLTLLDLTIFYTENLKQFKLRLAALGMQWNQFYSWGGQCLWIFKNVLVRWDVISWVTVLWHYNEGQFIVFRGSS